MTLGPLLDRKRAEPGNGYIVAFRGRIANCIECSGQYLLGLSFRNVGFLRDGLDQFAHSHSVVLLY